MRVQRWKALIVAGEVTQQWGLMFCFHFSKALLFYLLVIRPRKWLVTCSWEPMEKNTPPINGAAAGPGAERVGGGAADSLGGLWQ